MGYKLHLSAIEKISTPFLEFLLGFWEIIFWKCDSRERP